MLAYSLLHKITCHYCFFYSTERSNTWTKTLTVCVILQKKKPLALHLCVIVFIITHWRGSTYESLPESNSLQACKGLNRYLLSCAWRSKEICRRNEFFLLIHLLLHSSDVYSSSWGWGNPRTAAPHHFFTNIAVTYEDGSVEWDLKSVLLSWNSPPPERYINPFLLHLPQGKFYAA